MAKTTQTKPTQEEIKQIKANKNLNGTIRK